MPYAAAAPAAIPTPTITPAESAVAAPRAASSRTPAVAPPAPPTVAPTPATAAAFAFSFSSSVIDPPHLYTRSVVGGATVGKHAGLLPGWSYRINWDYGSPPTAPTPRRRGARAGIPPRPARWRRSRLQDLIANGPVLLAFFKITCPVCQLTFPFLERLHTAGTLPIYGISQNDAEDTREFNQHFGVTFPTLLDPRGERLPGQQRLRHLERSHHVPGRARRHDLARDRGLERSRRWSGSAESRARRRSAPEDNVPAVEGRLKLAQLGSRRESDRLE